MLRYEDLVFTSKLEEALEKMRQILGREKDSVQALRDVSHGYEDKYQVAEFLGGLAVGGWWNAGRALGASEEVAQETASWAASGEAIMLRFTMSTTCKYLRKETREVQPSFSTETETETTTTYSERRTRTKTVVKVTEHFWRFEATYTLSVYKGSDARGQLPISSSKCSATIKTLKSTKESPPYPSSTTGKPVDVDISSLVRALGEDGVAKVEIDRSSDETHTPRRNKVTGELFASFERLWVWVDAVWWEFNSLPSCPDATQTDPYSIFNPVAPVMGNTAITTLLVAQAESLESLPNNAEETLTLHTQRETHFLTVLNHVQALSASYCNGVDYLEETLRKQLEEAVGKQLTPDDFGAYMQHHYKTFFKLEQHRPKMFCHSVRREGCYPDGVLSIVSSSQGEEAPVEMFQRAFGKQTTTVRINSSTVVAMEGEVDVHCWMGQAFESKRGLSGGAVLAATARQFSCFVLLLGKLGSGNEFLPSNALIVKDKDEVRIPLEVEAIPTPKAFEAAVSSLSPEQQEFAEAYRVMQLEGSLFGVAVVQIKPQLEELLRLPSEALTKEVELTQSILQLFIEYHVPPDLIMFSEHDALPNLPTAGKVEIVRGHVSKVLNMIQQAKEGELREKRMRDTYANEGCVKRRRRCSSYEDRDRDRDRGRDRRGDTREDRRDDRREDVLSRRLKNKTSMMKTPTAAPMAAPLSTKDTDEYVMVPPDVEDLMERLDLGVEDWTETGAALHPMDEILSIPRRMNDALKKHDGNAALHAGTIKTGKQWTKKTRKSLLADEVTVTLETWSETAKAYSLLDSLTKSGAVTLLHTHLHAVTPTVHFFDRSLVDTLVQKNVNPKDGALRDPRQFSPSQ